MIVQIALLISRYHKLNNRLSIITITDYTEEIQHKIVTYVCLNSKYDIVNRTIQRFPSYIKDYGGSLFIKVVKKLRFDIMKLLIKNGVDIHYSYERALRWASAYGHLNIVKLLIENGADIHEDDDFALRWASGRGHLSVVKLLLEKGADIHALNDFALSSASSYRYLDVVEFLLEKGIKDYRENSRWDAIGPFIEKSTCHDEENDNVYLDIIESFELKSL